MGAFHGGSLNQDPEDKDGRHMPTLRVASKLEPPDMAKVQTAALRYKLFHAIEQLESNVPRVRHPYMDIVNSVRNNPRLVICKADKNLGLVKMSPAMYDRMCRLFLDKLTPVKHIPPSEIVQATQTAVHTWLRQTVELNVEFLPYQFILEGTSQCDKLPEFYALPKIHKGPPWRPRPIVAAFNAPTSRLSQWLSHVLVPVAQRSEFYLRDSSHLVDMLRERSFPRDAQLFIGDVEAMYPNMAREKAKESTMFSLKRVYASNREPSWTMVVPSAIDLLYNFNYFTYDRKSTEVYLQSSGIAMGSNASSPLSDLYLYKDEVEHLLPAVEAGELFYVRYRDDMCVICTPATFDRVLTPFTEAIKPMKVVWNKRSDKVAFLDVEITLRPGHAPRFNTFSKQRSMHIYLPPFSTHPPHTKVSWIYGELIRLHRTNSSKSSFLERIRSFAASLTQRGYGEALIMRAVRMWEANNPPPVRFPGPTTPLSKLPLVGNGAMPHRCAPPMVITVPSEPLIHQAILPALRREYAALQRIFPTLPDAKTCFTTGMKLGDRLSNK